MDFLILPLHMSCNPDITVKTFARFGNFRVLLLHMPCNPDIALNQLCYDLGLLNAARICSICCRANIYIYSKADCIVDKFLICMSSYWTYILEINIYILIYDRIAFLIQCICIVYCHVASYISNSSKMFTT